MLFAYRWLIAGPVIAALAICAPFTLADHDPTLPPSFTPDPDANISQPGICWKGTIGFYTGPTQSTAGAALDDAQRVAEELIPANRDCPVMRFIPHRGWVPDGTGRQPVGTVSAFHETVVLLQFTRAQRDLAIRAQSGSPCGGGFVNAFAVRDGQRNRFTGEIHRCPASYVIKLSRIDGFLESDAILASVEPGKPVTLVARVYDQNNQLVPNAAIELKLEAVSESGGHHHGDDTSPLRTGALSSNASGATVSDGGKVLQGNTDAAGLAFAHDVSKVSGDIKIRAQCTDGKNCTQEGADEVWVGIKNLVRLGASSEYELIGDTDLHPDNHYLTGEALNRVVVLSVLYRGQLKRFFPELEFDFKLHLNDASLERGGIFDIFNTWTRPHAEHCMGTAIDIRANDAPGAIPSWYREKFEELARVVGADPGELEIPRDSSGRRRPDLRHYHVRLMGQEGIQCP